MTASYPSHVLEFVRTSPWAILPSKLAEIREFLQIYSSAGSQDPAKRFAAIQAGARGPLPAERGTVAVIPLFGTLAPRMNLLTAVSGGTSLATFSRIFKQTLDDPAVSSIVIQVDSPGGNVYGTQEAADLIFSARGQKRVVAIADTGMAASAAYWIASQAEEFLATPSSEVGSIGVLAYHEDWSRAYDQAGITPTLWTAGKHKGELSDHEPLSDEARAAVQRSIDTYYSMFVSSVARGRGVKVAEVPERFRTGTNGWRSGGCPVGHDRSRRHDG